MIESITRQQQIVLLSLGIHGLESREDKTSFAWWDIPVPGTERVSYVEYSFDAKLGIDGQDVTIEQTGDDEFLITVPEFVFIGHENERFELATESNGVLSWMTPEIDKLEMASRILNDDTEREYVDKNSDTLRDQAKFFYGSIIGGIDPAIVVRFAFQP
ncbi:hypothetical protein [Orlajensenia leifsoniae]|uniref:DUF4230 domain-containing protein n=1 Tax=Orlajensenia leifsoniae TaxID=2561933 RepID=A0A4Y9QSF4_9MICO|nr:hypothetical protein [Leifsonia flava]TFV95391.1 hypothetical protein E4M00_15205 [Leifsonia flava]